MKFLLNTVQYEVVPAPNEGDEVQQAPQDQHEARPGGSGMNSGNRAHGVANPHQRDAPEQGGGAEGEPGMVTRESRRKSAAPERCIINRLFKLFIGLLFRIQLGV